jgi:hypothetical protein
MVWSSIPRSDEAVPLLAARKRKQDHQSSSRSSGRGYSSVFRSSCIRIMPIMICVANNNNNEFVRCLAFREDTWRQDDQDDDSFVH